MFNLCSVSVSGVVVNETKITTTIQVESKVTGELKKLLSTTKEADKIPVRLWLNEQSLENAEKLAWQETSALFLYIWGGSPMGR